METLVLQINLPQTRPIIIINLYRPPSGKINEAIETLQETLNELPFNTKQNKGNGL